MPNAYAQKAILTAVQTLVAAIPAFANASPAVVVRRQERPFWSAEHDDPLPMVSVSPLAEKSKGWATENSNRWDNPILVVFYQAQSGVIRSQTQIDEMLDRRCDIRDALIANGALGLAVVEDVDYDSEPTWDMAGLDALCHVSGQLFTYTTDETR